MANRGLARAREIMGARQERANAQQKEGKKVIGYMSIHVPLEIIDAVGMVPYRLLGDIREPVTEADRGLPAAFCPYMRSMLDLTLKGKLGWLDGLALAHPCDAQEKTVRIMTSMAEFPFHHFIDVPATVHDYDVEFFTHQVTDFKKSMEQYAGVTLSEDRLRQAIEARNEQRALMRELYDRKKSDPPALSGRETLEVVLAVQALPVDEGTALLREVLEEVGERRLPEGEDKVRLLVWGSIIDDAAYLDVIESSGAEVVIDDLDEGTRTYVSDVETSGDLMRNLAWKYLVGTPTPRTFVDAGDGPVKKDNVRDLSARYQHLKRYIDDWNVDGVVIQSVRYCDPHGYEVVDVMDYMRHLEMPAIYVEHNYSEGAFAPLRTRMEAFVETLE